MTKSEQIREALRKTPRLSNVQLVEATKIPLKEVATRTSYMVKNGMLERHESGTTLSGVARYVFTVTGKPGGKPGIKPGTKLKRRKAAEIRQENDLPTNTFSQKAASLDSLVESMAEGLVAQLVQRVKAKLPAALASVAPAAHLVQVTMDEPRLTLPQPEETVRERLPRIALVGVLKTQHAAIDKALNGTVQTRSWCSGDGFGNLGAVAQWADTTFIMTGKVSHPAQQVVQSHTRAANIVLVSGGPTGMKRAIAKYFGKETA